MQNISATWHQSIKFLLHFQTLSKRIAQEPIGLFGNCKTDEIEEKEEERESKEEIFQRVYVEA